MIHSATAQQSLQINVYLKPSQDDPSVETCIRAINAEMAQKGIFKAGEIHPFIDTYPLHISLYLSRYEADKLLSIKKAVAALAKDSSSLTVEMGQLWVSPSLYVMLDVGREKNPGFARLQALSDEAVKRLASLHDRNMPVPLWAANNPNKKTMVERYGSPNVFSEFNPHFTLMATRIDDEARAKNLYQRIQAALSAYSQSHPQRPTQLLDSIGVGLVDQYGQIKQELASFPLY